MTLVSSSTRVIGVEHKKLGGKIAVDATQRNGGENTSTCKEKKKKEEAKTEILMESQNKEKKFLFSCVLGHAIYTSTIS